MNADIEPRARALHAWFEGVTGQTIPLRMDRLLMWEAWLVAGHSGPELRKVMTYLRTQISKGKRNEGCMKLSSLLDVTKFEEDLGLALMSKSGFLDPERKIAAPPDAKPKQTMVKADEEAPITVKTPYSILEEFRKIQ